MPATSDKPLTPEEIEQIAATAPENAQVKVFCINGVIVEIPFREALKRLPYDVMMMQTDMKMVIEAQGRHADFLTPMTSDMILQDVGSGRELENINKNTVNAVALMKGGNQVFGDDQDGILRGSPPPPMSNNPNDHL